MLRGFCITYHACIQSLSHVQVFAAPWTVAPQMPVSMGFSRGPLRLGTRPISPAGRLLSTEPPEAPQWHLAESLSLVSGFMTKLTTALFLSAV